MPGGREPQKNGLARSWGNDQGIVCRHLRPDTIWIHRFLRSRDHGIVKTILNKRCPVRHAPQTLCIALIFGEEQWWLSLACKPILPQCGMRCMNELDSTLQLAFYTT